MRIAICMLLLWATTLSAEGVNAAIKSHSEKLDNANSSKIWNLRDADIRAVIGEISRITGKNFIIDPRVQGKISISSGSPMTNEALYQVFLSMLQVTGFSAVPSGDIIKIMPAMDARSQAPDLLNQIKHPPHGEDIMIQVIPVQHVPAEQLVPVLRPLMPQFSNVSAYSPSNTLILSGQANNIKQLARIISQVDTSSANGVDIIPLHHALAMDVVNTLKDIVKAPANGGSAQTNIAADDRGNTILLSGSKADRIKYRLIIAQLDSNHPSGDSSNTQVVYLNYLRAEDLVPILAGIAQANFTGTVGTTIGTITRPALDSTNPSASMANNASASGQSAAPTTAPPSGDPSQKPAGSSNQNEGSSKPTVQIIAEPNTNSVIINAPSTLIRILKKVISQLDIRPAQLLIEALVAEINETDVNSLGIEWGNTSQDGNKTFQPGFAIINSKVSLSQFQSQIYALVTEHRANILSTPSVVVLDNRQAKILVGKQVSIASSSYPNNGNGTTNAGTPYTTFDRVNVALHLYVRPQITHERGIQMQIDQGNDTLDAASSVQPGATPTFNISAIVTSVHVESGDIVVLGGLTQDTLGNDAVNIPILGNIPGLGKLFQHNVSNRDKKVLMVFIKTSILRDEKDTVNISGSKYNYARQTELEFLRNQDYNIHNNDSSLKPMHTATLPKPFSHPNLPKPNVAMK